jgi:hypothetical protein
VCLPLENPVLPVLPLEYLEHFAYYNLSGGYFASRSMERKTGVEPATFSLAISSSSYPSRIHLFPAVLIYTPNLIPRVNHCNSVLLSELPSGTPIISFRA